MNKIKEEMQKIVPNLRIYLDEELSKYTYTKTGGPADVLIFPKNNQEVQKVIQYCQEQQMEWLVLGNSSNLIVRDGGIAGVVIMLDEMNHIEVRGHQVYAQAGAKLVDVAQVAAQSELTGLEFACGIPGSIGGGIYMNAGAYGGEMKDVFLSADILFPNGEIITYTKEEMNFHYRHSFLQETKAIVLSVILQLALGEKQQIDERMQELTDLRESKQPLEYPSCGSVFKRPEGYFTGKLIQDAGLQGLKWGGAQISEKHAGFIVNVNQASATDYIELIQYIQKIILEKYSVQLETEVRIIGRE